MISMSGVPHKSIGAVIYGVGSSWMLFKTPCRLHVSKEKCCRSEEVVAKCVRLILPSGEVVRFTPEASLPSSRNTDGILGSLGLDVSSIAYGYLVYIVVCLIP